MKRLLLFAVVAASASITGLACDDESGVRAPFDGEGGAVDDTPEASLPPRADAASTTDAAARTWDAADVPVVCATKPCATQLVSGLHHFCARIDDGTVRCWGDDTQGALGRGEPDGGDPLADRPGAVVGVMNATQISAGGSATCARIDDGTVRCWGDHSRGQLGLAEPLADGAPHPTPATAAIGAAAVRVDVGPRGACAVTAAGGLVCWGANDAQQLARSEAGAIAAPGPADLGGALVTRAALSESTTYGVSASSPLLVWGAPAARESSLPADPVPAPIPELAGVTSVAAGLYHACAIAGAKAYCWGANVKGVLCTGGVASSTFPRLAPVRGAFPQQIAAAADHTCVRLDDGTIECCGDGSKGQLGAGKAQDSTPAFTTASALEGHAVQVATSEAATCALLRDGSVACWGGNEHGELGQGTRDADPHPLPVHVTLGP